MTDGWRDTCLQCGEEFAGRSKTNFCAVCCHKGIEDDLREEHGFFVSEPADDSSDLDRDTTTERQTGLSDFA